MKLAGGFSFSIDFIPLFLTVHVFGDLDCLFSFYMHSFGFVLCVVFGCLCFLFCLATARRSNGGGLLWVGSQNKCDTHFEYLALSFHIKI